MSARILTHDEELVAARLEKEKLKKEEYDIVEFLGLYRGSPVDYSAVKRDFILAVRSKIINTTTTTITTTPSTTTTLSTLPTSTSKKIPTKDEEEVKEKGTEEGLKTGVEREKLLKKEGEAKGYDLVGDKVLTSKDKEVVYSVEKEVFDAARRIGVFLNLNGTSGSRKQILVINENSYDINELMRILGIENQARTGGTREKTDRKALTVERISCCYSDETSNFLKTHPTLSKIKKLDFLGFTKSYFCYDVKNNPETAARVYYHYLEYAKTWISGRPERFAEKMKNYYLLVLDYSPRFFEKIEADFEESLFLLEKREGKEKEKRGERLTTNSSSYGRR